MTDVKVDDFSLKVIGALDDAALQFLEEAGSELEAQTKRNQTRVDSGETKGHWTHVVDESKGVCTIGNPLENAIWEEFGTGEYVLEGNGRKGGWWYQDKDTGEWHHTEGKTPLRPLHNAYVAKKDAIIRRAAQVFKGRLK